LARAREEIQAGADPGDLRERVEAELEAVRGARLCRVINATGVIVHTNLGRAPLAPDALEQVRAVAGGYSNLASDLGEGGRGSRQDHVAPILRRLTGAEAALVVNNNAAAVLLALAALAEGREVLVSRGELIEIGDGFRIPDVLTRSGARLREVGTTSRARGRLRACNWARDGPPAPRPPVELPCRRLHGAAEARRPRPGRARSWAAARGRPGLGRSLRQWERAVRRRANGPRKPRSRRRSR